MTLYESFLEAVTTEYDTLRVLKQSDMLHLLYILMSI